MSQGALFGLRLPREKIDTHLNISDVSIVGSSVKAVYTNKTHTTGPYNVAIVTIGEDGRLVPASTVQNISSLANNASQSKTFTLRGKLPEGTYKLSPASKLRTSDVWHPAYNMMTGQYIEAVVDSLGEISMNMRYPTTEIISIDTIVFPGTRIQKSTSATETASASIRLSSQAFASSDRNSGVFLPLITTNCCILGVAILVANGTYATQGLEPNLLTGVVFAISTAIGFALALVVFAGIREQLAMMDVPKGLQGMSIALITAGLLAMAFMGFSGVDNGLRTLFGL